MNTEIKLNIILFITYTVAEFKRIFLYLGADRATGLS
jgi:hypothetical protein